MTPGLIWERSLALSPCLLVFPAGTDGVEVKGREQSLGPVSMQKSAAS